MTVFYIHLCNLTTCKHSHSNQNGGREREEMMAEGRGGRGRKGGRREGRERAEGWEKGGKEGRRMRDKR